MIIIIAIVILPSPSSSSSSSQPQPRPSPSLVPIPQTNHPITTLPHVAIDPLPLPANHSAHPPLARCQASRPMRIDIYINSPICDSAFLVIIP